MLTFGLAVRAFAGGLLPPARGVVATPWTVDLDKAGVAELQILPGIGVARAEAIVLERVRNGPFHGLADLERVDGLGPEAIRRLAPHVAFVRR